VEKKDTFLPLMANLQQFCGIERCAKNARSQSDTDVVGARWGGGAKKEFLFRQQFLKGKGKDMARRLGEWRRGGGGKTSINGT